MTPEEHKVIPAILKRNFRLFCATNFFTGALFTIPIYILFGREYLHLSYLQAGSFFLVAWCLSLALDFVGGILADKYGRKRIFVTGLVLQIVGTTPFIFVKDYPLLLLSSLVIGLGMALVSNTVTALLYEQASELGHKRYYQHANATALAYSYGGRILASIAGGIAYAVHPTLPYLLTVISLILALAAGLAMRFSPKVEEQLEQKSTIQLSRSALKVFTSNRGLIKFTLIVALISIWGDYIFTYYQPYYLQFGVSSIELGYLFAAISLFSALGTLAMRKLPNKLSAHAINSITIGGIIITALLLEFLRIPVVYLAPLVMGAISGLTLPNLNLYINKHAPSAIRSSVLSIATTTMGVGSGIGIFTALQLVGQFGQDMILSIVIVGSLCTLLLNVGINVREQEEDKPDPTG